MGIAIRIFAITGVLLLSVLAIPLYLGELLAGKWADRRRDRRNRRDVAADAIAARASEDHAADRWAFENRAEPYEQN